MVLLPGLVAGTGGHASFDLVLDAGTRGLPIDLDLAGRQGEDPPDHLERFPHRPGRDIRTIVQGAVLLNLPDDRKPGKILFDRQP